MAANTGYTTIKLRRDTTTNWTTGTKALEEGEVGLDTTTGKIKYGTSSNQAWADAKNVAVVQSDSASHVSGGAAGDLLYQSSSGTTAKLNIGGSGTFVYTSNGSSLSWYKPKLSDLAATTSAELRSVLSDETGSGAAVFGTSPSITSATLTTPTIGGAGVTFNGSSSGTTVLVATAAAAGTLTLPAPASTETLITSESVASGYVAKSGSTMSGTLNMGTNAISGVTTLAASGAITLTGVSGASSGVAKVAANGPLTGGNKVSLTADVDTGTLLPVAQGGFGVSAGTTPLGSGLAAARSVTRIFVQSAEPASGNITGYSPAVGDLWLW